MEWDEEIRFHLYCNKGLWTEFFSRSELRARPGGTLCSQWAEWLWWPSPQMPAAHPAPLSIWPYAQRSDINFWSNSSFPRIDVVSLKTFSYVVWDYTLNMFCYPSMLESFAVRQRSHTWNKNTWEIQTEPIWRKIGICKEFLKMRFSVLCFDFVFSFPNRDKIPHFPHFFPSPSIFKTFQFNIDSIA